MSDHKNEPVSPIEMASEWITSPYPCVCSFIEDIDRSEIELERYSTEVSYTCSQVIPACCCSLISVGEAATPMSRVCKVGGLFGSENPRVQRDVTPYVHTNSI